MIYNSIDEIPEPRLFCAKHHEDAFRFFVNGPDSYISDRQIWLIRKLDHPISTFSQISSPDDIESVEKFLDAIDGYEGKAMVMFNSEPTESIIALLKDKGFTKRSDSGLLHVNIDEMRHTELPEGYEFIKIETDEQSDAWCEMQGGVFSMPPGVVELFAPKRVGMDRDDTQYFGVMHEGRMVSGSQYLLLNGTAGIYCVGTVPEERGKGLGAHATAEPLRIAAKLGYRVGTLQSSKLGHPVYVGLGFREFGTKPAFMRTGE